MKIVRKSQSDRMSKIVVHNHTVYLSGQVADDTNVGIEEQTQSCLLKIEALLNEGGSSKAHLLAATIYLRDMKDFDAMNEVWNHWTIDGEKPARACVEARMARDEILVEMSVTAAVI